MIVAILFTLGLLIGAAVLAVGVFLFLAAGGGRPK